MSMSSRGCIGIFIVVVGCLLPARAFAAESPAPAGWQSRVSEDLKHREYQFSPVQSGSWSAPNRAHELRALIEAGGIELTSRTKGTDEKDGGWILRLNLSAYGREGGLAAVEPVPPEGQGNRVELRRHDLTEWYRNDEKGLEQGFTIERPPEKGGSNQPLILEMSLAGGLAAYPSEDRQSILFKTAKGDSVLRYAELTVTDTTGAKVEAALALSPGRLHIRIQDQGARYPLTVDPLMSSPAWTAEGDQASAHLGFSVAGAGDVNRDGFSDVIVGADLFDNGQVDEGRAFVYLGSPSGLAMTPAWTAEGDQGGASFGFSVASAGDVNGDGFSDVIVGAPYFDNGQADEGRAFLWLGSPSGPNLGIPGTPSNAAWTAESNQASAYFGFSVAGAGDVNGDGFSDVIVGAPDFDNGQADEGRAFLYLGEASSVGLALAPAWTAESNQASAHFGISVAGAGDVNGDGFSDVIVGAPYFDNGQGDEGRAFLYLGEASSAGLALAPAWTAESDQIGAHFGISVAGAGDVNGDGFSDVILGAYTFGNGQGGEGRAFLYLGEASSAGLGSTPAWTAESDQAGALFGYFVASAGDVNGDGFSDVIVGAPLFDNGQADEGRAFLYLGCASGLGSTPAWTAESDQGSAQLGLSVASAGDVNGDGFSDVIIGANFFDNGENDEGRAFVYLGSASGLAFTPAWTAVSDQIDAFFGVSVASAGDVNADGFSDVIVGAPNFDNGQASEGGVFVYLGSASGLALTPAWTAESNQTGSFVGVYFGGSVASAGDVNGDGFSDVIVGAYRYDNSQVDEGRAFVWLGSPSGPNLGIPGTPSNAAWTAEGNQASAHFGLSVASAGDVNGDGFSDVIVGAPYFGWAFLYLGSASGLALTPAWTAQSGQATAAFGWSVASAGDVNGDGFSDVIVGAPSYNKSLYHEGRAFLYLGSSSGLALTPAWTAEGNQEQADFGVSVASAGDVNGDGFSDVIIGAEWFDNGQVDEGRAFVYLGSASGLTFAPAWTAESDQINNYFGESVASAGDVNGDGFSDVIVGAFASNFPRAFLYFGSPSGLAITAAWTGMSGLAGEFGYSVASAGDVNGDGFSDIIVGSTSMAFLFVGNDSCSSVGRAARQAQPAGTALIGPLGKSASTSSFRLKAIGRTPAGRGRVRLEWEVKPLGTGFDGTSLNWGTTLNTGVPIPGQGSAVLLNEPVGGLALGTRYHWRLRIVSNSAIFPHSPWLTPPYNGRNETDFRTDGCRDGDGDGYGSPGDLLCPGGPLLDCNDSSPAIHPGATEVCNGVDDNCNGGVDEGFDQDMDGFTTCAGDCNDSAKEIHPGAMEVCNGVDDNCIGGVDEGFDQDADAYTTCGGDCDDTNPLIHPGVAEVCDGVDNDCTGAPDDWHPLFTLTQFTDVTHIDWNHPGGYASDVVWGDLVALRSSFGDFSVATRGCLGDDLAGPPVLDFTNPAVGGGFWYLVRAACGANGGTYNSGDPGQVGDRDAEIAASGLDCP